MVAWPVGIRSRSGCSFGLKYRNASDGKPDSRAGSLCFCLIAPPILTEWLGVLRCATMDVSVREFRNHTARVIAAVEGGEPVVLTVHGRPVADIVPRRVRSERRPSELLLADLAAINDLASELDVASDASDFDVGLTTDDMVA